MAHVVILGGGFAGLLAARQLRGAKVTLVSATDTFYERVRFHQIAAGQDVPGYPIRQMLGDSDVTLRCGQVESLDPAAGTVTVATGGQRERLGWDHLVYALGSGGNTGAVPGAAEHAEVVATETGARKMAARLKALPDGGRVTVVGGGLTAIELASEIAESMPRLKVALITAGELAPSVGPRGRAYLQRSLERMGVEVVTGTAIEAVTADAVVLAGGVERPSDLCAWAASFGLSPLAREAGLTVNAAGQVLVDPTLRALSHPAIFAAGDAAMPAASPGAPIRMGCATALPMATVAARNLGALLRGERPVDFGYRYLAQFVSLGRKNALAQLTRGDDSPRSVILRGRFAAWLKEMTFRYNLRGLRTGFYPFPSKMLAPKRPELPAAV